MIRWRLMKSTSSRELLLRDRHELTGGRMVVLGLGPGRHRVAAVEARGDAAELLLRLPQLARRNGEQAVGAERDALHPA